MPDSPAPLPTVGRRDPVRPMMEWALDRDATARLIQMLTLSMPNIEIVPSGCWEWTGSKDADGYGKASRNGKSAGAHRWLWELVVGPVPDGLELDHLCRVKHCVNPAHLEPVTPEENMRRQRIDRGVYICTKHGPKTPTASGYFRCKPCKTARERRRRAKITGTEPPVHGTRSSYTNYNCRCDACGDAQRAYSAERQETLSSRGEAR